MNKQKTSTSIPESDDILVRLDKLEKRIVVLEGLLNDVAHHVNQHVCHQASTNAKQSKSKLTSKRETTDAEMSKRQDQPTSKNISDSREQCESEILDFLNDGKIIRLSHFGNRVMTHFTPKMLRRTLDKLRREKKISMHTVSKVCFVELHIEVKGDACRQFILKFFEDGKKVVYSKVFSELPLHDYSDHMIKSVLGSLIKEGKIVKITQLIDYNNKLKLLTIAES